jgi:hypothetical protein
MRGSRSRQKLEKFVRISHFAVAVQSSSMMIGCACPWPAPRAPGERGVAANTSRGTRVCSHSHSTGAGCTRDSRMTKWTFNDGDSRHHHHSRIITASEPKKSNIHLLLGGPPLGTFALAVLCDRVGLGSSATPKLTLGGSITPLADIYGSHGLPWRKRPFNVWGSTLPIGSTDLPAKQ